MDDEEDARPVFSAEYAAAIGVRSAPWGRRILASAFDIVLVAIAAIPLAIALPGVLGLSLRIAAGADPVALVRSGALTGTLVAYGIGQGALWILLIVQTLVLGLRGVTAGKGVFGLRSVNALRLTPPGFWRALLRGVVLWAAAAILPIVGPAILLLSPLWGARRRGWLDQLSASWLVDARRGLDPADAKALRLARKRVDSPPPEPDAPLPSLSTNTSGSFANYLPADRSSSGVVSLAGPDAPAWSPPPLVEQRPPAEAPVVRTTPPAVAIGSAVLVLGDGRRVPIDGPRVLGRNPVPDDQAEALALHDPSMQLSKTHAEVGVEAGRPWVLDRHSANGTALLDAAGHETRLEPGVRHPVAWGASIQLGGLRVRIDAPSSQESA